MRMFVLLFTAVLIFAVPAHAQEKFLNIQEVTSASGLKAWLVEDHSVPIIALTFNFQGAGSAQDAIEKQGLAQLASNTMDEGAGDLESQAFQKQLRDLSIALSFGASRDHFGGSLKTLSVNKDKAFELLTLALTKPRFDEESVERMKAANLSRIRESMTDPEWIAARLQNDRAFEGHVYGQNAGGSLSTIAALAPPDLHQFAKTRLGKNNVKISVSGDITPAELAVIMDKVFASLPDVTLPTLPPIELQNKNKTFVYTKDIPQTIIRILQPGIDQKDDDYQTMQIVNYILGGSGFGSRLMDEVREKRGLTYGIYTSFFLTDCFNGYVAETSTENKNVPEVLRLVKQEWADMVAAPPSGKELKDAQTYLLGSLPLNLTSTMDIAQLMNSLQAEDLPINYLDTRAEKIKAVTPQDVQKVAQRILNDQNFMTVLVGSPEAIENATIVKDIPNVK